MHRKYFLSFLLHTQFLRNQTKIKAKKAMIAVPPFPDIKMLLEIFLTVKQCSQVVICGQCRVFVNGICASLKKKTESILSKNSILKTS